MARAGDGVKKRWGMQICNPVEMWDLTLVSGRTRGINPKADHSIVPIIPTATTRLTPNRTN